MGYVLIEFMYIKLGFGKKHEGMRECLLITLFIQYCTVKLCVGALKSYHHQAVTVKLVKERIKLQFRSPKSQGGSFHSHMKLGKQLHWYSLVW